MKKFIVPLIIILILTLLSLLAFALYSIYFNKQEAIYTDFSSTILENSSWCALSKEDFNSLVLKSYSHNILTLLNSLESGIPVIVKVAGGTLAEEGKYNFIVASSFATSDTVYIYVKIGDSYKKTTVSLEKLLEDADRFFVLKDTEVLK